MREYGQIAVRAARPLLLRFVPIKLHPVSVRGAEIDGFTDTVIRRSFERNIGFKQSSERGCQFRPRRIQDGDMVQPGRAGRRRLASGALPCVQSDVTMVTTGRQECRLRPKSLSDIKAEHVAIKCQRAVQVGHFQVNVTDPDVRADAIWAGLWVHNRQTAQPQPISHSRPSAPKTGVWKWAAGG